MNTNKTNNVNGELLSFPEDILNADYGEKPNLMTRLLKEAEDTINPADMFMGLSKKSESKKSEGLDKPKPQPKKNKQLAKAKEPTPTNLTAIEESKELTGRFMPKASNANAQESDKLWSSFLDCCVNEEKNTYNVGKDGNASFCRISKEILNSFKRYPVEGHDLQVVVNAVLRSFLLHFKSNFKEYKKASRDCLF